MAAEERRTTDTAKAVARAAGTAFGGQPGVRRLRDAERDAFVDVLHCDDRPQTGWTTYSTVTLHAETNLLEGQDVRVELMAVGRRNDIDFATMLAAIGLRLIKEHWLIAPGVVIPDAVRDAGLSHAIPHAILTPPFAWEGLNRVVVNRTLTVHWLLAVPIYESERKFLQASGFDELEDLFARRDVPYFDLERVPVA